MIKIKIKWISETESAIPKVKNGEKFPVKKGDTIEISEDVYAWLSQSYKNHIEVLPEKSHDKKESKPKEEEKPIEKKEKKKTSKK